MQGMPENAIWSPADGDVFGWGSLGWDVEVMTRSATYRVERPTSVFASGALRSARTRWELKEQPG